MRGSFARRFSTLGIALALLGPVAARAGEPPDTASPEAAARAQRHYDEGVQLFKEARFAGAADAFQRSYGEVASPNAHLMYARALERSGAKHLAYEELVITVREAKQLAERVPRYSEAADKAEAELAALRPQVAVLNVTLDPHATDVSLFVGERQVPPPRWASIGVPPGPVDVVARLPGGRRVWKLVTARAGLVTDVALDLEESTDEPPPGPAPVARAPAASPASSPPPADEPPAEDVGPSLRPFAFGAFAVGAAGFITFVAAGSMSRATFSDLEDACRRGVCPPSRADDIDRGKSEQTIANVGLVFGLLGAGGGAVLWVLDRPRAERGAGDGTRVALGPGTLRVVGSFR